MRRNWSGIIIPGITGKTEKEWRSKLKEINDLGLKTVGLFLAQYPKSQRELIYQTL